MAGFPTGNSGWAIMGISDDRCGPVSNTRFYRRYDVTCSKTSCRDWSSSPINGVMPWLLSTRKAEYLVETTEDEWKYREHWTGTEKVTIITTNATRASFEASYSIGKPIFSIIDFNHYL